MKGVRVVSFHLQHIHNDFTNEWILCEWMNEWKSCEFCEISKNTFFTEHVRATAPVYNSW